MQLLPTPQGGAAAGLASGPQCCSRDGDGNGEWRWWCAWQQPGGTCARGSGLSPCWGITQWPGEHPSRAVDPGQGTAARMQDHDGACCQRGVMVQLRDLRTTARGDCAAADIVAALPHLQPSAPVAAAAAAAETEFCNGPAKGARCAMCSGTRMVTPRGRDTRRRGGRDASGIAIGRRPNGTRCASRCSPAASTRQERRQAPSYRSTMQSLNTDGHARRTEQRQTPGGQWPCGCPCEHQCRA